MKTLTKFRLKTIRKNQNGNVATPPADATTPADETPNDTTPNPSVGGTKTEAELLAEIEALRKAKNELLDEKKKATAKEREAEQARQNAEAEKARKEGDFTKIEEQYKTEIDGLKATIAKYEAKERNRLLTDTASKISANLSDDPNNRELLEMVILNRLTVEGDAVKLLEADGSPSIRGIEALETELKTSGKYNALITGTKANGVGATGGGQQGKQAGDYTEAERLELLQTNPTKFKELFGKKK